MAKTDIINARIEPSLKSASENILKALGLSTTEAITLFLRQVVLNQGLPFEVRLPNQESRKAMENALAGKNTTTYKSLDDLKKDLS